MDCVAGGGGAGTDRGSAIWVMALQIAQRMDLAFGGSCKGVWQFEQLTRRLGVGLYMVVFGRS